MKTSVLGPGGGFHENFPHPGSTWERNRSSLGVDWRGERETGVALETRTTPVGDRWSVVELVVHLVCEAGVGVSQGVDLRAVAEDVS